ncbi:MAG: lysylphosphatidylglycerol synthase domain-containing protein [Hyphomicrobiaceae bacterium]
MKRVLTAVLAAGITAACLWLLLTPQVLAALGRLGSQAKLMPLLVAFALIALVQWLRAWRFAVMSTGRLALPERPLIRIALQLNFLNFVLPFRLGELSYPALMRHQYGYGLVRSAGVLLLARLFDLATVVAILLGAAALLSATPAGRAGLGLGALLFALAPFALALLGEALWPRLLRVARIAQGGADLRAAFPAIARGPARLAVGLGFAIWLVFSLAAVLVADAVVETVPPTAAMLGAAAGNIAFALPINGLAGLGPAQAAWVLATTWAGVPQEDAMVSALALHAVALLNALLFGGLALASGFGRPPAGAAPAPLPQPGSASSRAQPSP